MVGVGGEAGFGVIFGVPAAGESGFAMGFVVGFAGTVFLMGAPFLGGFAAVRVKGRSARRRAGERMPWRIGWFGSRSYAGVGRA